MMRRDAACDSLWGRECGGAKEGVGDCSLRGWSAEADCWDVWGLAGRDREAVVLGHGGANVWAGDRRDEAWSAGRRAGEVPACRVYLEKSMDTHCANGPVDRGLGLETR